MTALLIVLIVVLVLVAAFAIPRFGLALLVGVLVLGGWLYLAGVEADKRAQAESTREQAEVALSRTRIAASELNLIEPRLQPSYDAEHYEVVGRIRNRSTYTLTSVTVALGMMDSPFTTQDRVNAAATIKDLDRVAVERAGGAEYLQGEDRAEFREQMARAITIRDQCQRSDTVGDIKVEVLLDVPPRQVRGFSATVRFPGLPAAFLTDEAARDGRHQWGIALVGLTGREARP